MLRKFIIFFYIFLISLLLASCDEDKKFTEKQEFHMGTLVMQKVYGKNRDKAIDEAMEKIDRLEKLMTINAPGGDINMLNKMSGIKDVKLDHETFYVLKTAEKFASITEGGFDVTVGPLVKAWGVFTEHPRIPSDKEISELLKLVDYKSINLNEKEMTAKLEKKGQIVDLGGITKGYAGDAVIKIYKKYGIKSATVNLGGNVVVLGSKPDGSPWKIAVQNPRGENGSYIGVLRVVNKAIVTSGDYERYFEKDGVRYHHILDPKTGRPANSGLISVTIVTDKSIEADAMAKIFVLGLDKGMEVIKRSKGYEAIFITSDKKVYITNGLKDIFTFDDKSNLFELVTK
jgi:FAD:protein FMN transferase